MSIITKENIIEFLQDFHTEDTINRAIDEAQDDALGLIEWMTSHRNELIEGTLEYHKGCADDAKIDMAMEVS